MACTYTNGLLDGSGRRLRSVKEARIAGADVSDIVEANFSNNEIENTDGTELYSRLETLELRHNNIDAVTHLPITLRYLDLSYNKIHDLPGNVLSRCVNLVELDVSYNLLTSLVGSLTANNDLNTLKVAGNRISSIEGIEHLRFLDNLDFRNNLISKTQDLRALSVHSTLKSLQLKGNPVCKQASYRFTCLHLIQNLITLDGEPTPKHRGSVSRGIGGKSDASSVSSGQALKNTRRGSQQGTPSINRRGSQSSMGSFARRGSTPRNKSPLRKSSITMTKDPEPVTATSNSVDQNIQDMIDLKMQSLDVMDEALRQCTADNQQLKKQIRDLEEELQSVRFQKDEMGAHYAADRDVSEKLVRDLKEKLSLAHNTTNDSASNAKLEIDMYQKRVDALEAELTEIQRENQALNEQVRVSVKDRSSLDNLHKDYSSLQKQLSESEAERVAIVAKARAERADLLRELNAVKAECTHLKESQNSNTEVDGEIRYLRDQLTQVKEERDLLIKDLRGLKQVYSIGDEERVRLQEQNRELSELVKQYKSNEEQISKRAETDQKYYKDRVIELEYELSQKNGDMDMVVAKMETERNKLLKEVSHLHETLRINRTDADNALFEEKAQKESFNQELQNLRDYVHQLKQHHNRTQGELESDRSRLDKVQQELETSRKEKSEIEVQSKAHSDVLVKLAKNLESHLNVTREEKEAALTDVAELRRQVAALQEQLSNTTDAKDGSNAELRETRKELTMMKANHEQLQKRTDADRATMQVRQRQLEEQLSQSNSYAARAESEKSEALARLSRVEALANVGSHQQALTTVQAERIAELERDVKSLREALDVANVTGKHKLDDLKARNLALQAQNEDLASRVSVSTAEENAALKKKAQRADDLEGRLSQLTREHHDSLDRHRTESSEWSTKVRDLSDRVEFLVHENQKLHSKVALFATDDASKGIASTPISSTPASKIYGNDAPRSVGGPGGMHQDSPGLNQIRDRIDKARLEKEEAMNEAEQRRTSIENRLKNLEGSLRLGQ